jgi:hypothetical protein
LKNTTDFFVISDVLPGKLNALVKNIMKQTGAEDPNEAVRLVNSGEWTLTGSVQKWTEKDGVIYLSVTSDGTTGKEWITRLQSKGFRVSDYAKSVLGSASFKPTNGITYEIAVLKDMLWNDNDRITKKIRTYATERQLSAPNAEVACLIREKFSDKDIEAMGLHWIVVMHEPIKDYDGDPLLLNADRNDDGSWLDASYGSPGSKWSRGSGFAFVMSQGLSV